MSNDRVEKLHCKHIEKAEHINKIYQDCITELKTAERFVNYFKSYNDQSVKNFIEFYAGQKANWYSGVDLLYRHQLSKKNKWRWKALGMLKEIFIKKLFDLKCRWVAGEMDLEGIEVSPDFEKWACDPASCTAVEPITGEEFSCYMSFVEAQDDQDGRQYDDEDRGTCDSALNFYHDYRSLFVGSHERLIPEWFHYYDRRFGTAPLLGLPVKRTDLEADYNDTWCTEIYAKTLTPEQLKTWSHSSRKQRKELRENPEKNKAHIEEQNRIYQERKKETNYSHMSIYDREMMKELVALTEPPEVSKLYKASELWKKRRQGGEEIECTLIYMEEAKEYIPIEGDDDYREAIKKAFADYARRMKMETLPMLFEQYCECIQRGKPFDWSTGGDKKLSGNDLRDRIIAARKCKGEPENLDFLKKENLS